MQGRGRVHPTGWAQGGAAVWAVTRWGHRRLRGATRVSGTAKGSRLGRQRKQAAARERDRTACAKAARRLPARNLSDPGLGLLGSITSTSRAASQE